jgi:hypothetical protein
MKRKTRKDLSVASALIILITGLSIAFIFLKYPPSAYHYIAGTFAKADKHRGEAITEKDVHFRTDLTKDTARFSAVLKYMITMNQYCYGITRQIDSMSGIISGCLPAGNPRLLVQLYDLKIFKSWLINQNIRSEQTIFNLLEIYTGSDRVDDSRDVEQDLREYTRFLVQLSQKDSVLYTTAMMLDACQRSVGDCGDAPGGCREQLRFFSDQLMTDFLLSALLRNDKKSFEKSAAYFTAGRFNRKSEDLAGMAIFSGKVLYGWIEPEEAIAKLGGGIPQAYENLRVLYGYLGLGRIEPEAIGTLGIEEFLATGSLGYTPTEDWRNNPPF